MKKEKKNTREHPLQVYCKTCGKLLVEVEADWYQFNWYYAPLEIRPPLRELFPGITNEQFLGLKYRKCEQCRKQKKQGICI